MRRQDPPSTFQLFAGWSWAGSEKNIAMSLHCTERELSFELLFKKGTGGVERASESSAFVFFLFSAF